MVLELTKAMFRRLVMLELLITVVAVPLLVWQQLQPEWIKFDAEFEALIVGMGGRTAMSDSELVLSAPILVSLVVALIGLLSFKPWARTLYLASWGAALLLSLFWFGPANYATAAEDLIETLDDVIGGAILTLAYGRSLGADWFAGTSSNPS
ncbi:hypothetical protein [Sphingomonas montana]|uniref:hypothetical protein n=1 Tax=Sphingomonas montana TaxID=1843236 RepID=UPI00096F0844|nr:hypothetical protein [Sphingomonas montana]